MDLNRNAIQLKIPTRFTNVTDLKATLTLMFWNEDFAPLDLFRHSYGMNIKAWRGLITEDSSPADRIVTLRTIRSQTSSKLIVSKIKLDEKTHISLLQPVQ